LGDLLGHGTTADGRLGKAKHARLVALDQRNERRLVARAKAVYQLSVVVHGA
jgi:hypothetical protein